MVLPIPSEPKSEPGHQRDGRTGAVPNRRAARHKGRRRSRQALKQGEDHGLNLLDRRSRTSFEGRLRHPGTASP